MNWSQGVILRRGFPAGLYLLAFDYVGILNGRIHYSLRPRGIADSDLDIP